MRHFLFAALLSLIVPTLSTLPAHAQASRTWVSGVGDDVNPCSRTAPCKTFAGAISKTAASGEINCLDSAGFGALTITKAISVLCQGVVGGVVVSGTNGFIVNAGVGDRVVIKGLDFEGFGTGLAGIRVLQAASVVIEDVIIRNFKGANASGIQIVPSAAAVKFVVTRTTLVNNGTGAVGAGIQIRPTGAVSVTGVIDDVVADGNVFGVALDGSGNASATMNVTLRDSVISGNSSTGVVVTTGANGAGLMVARTTMANNAIGVQASGSGAVVRVGFSEITGNTTGVSGSVLSYGNNQLNGNGTDGTLTAVPGGLH